MSWSLLALACAATALATWLLTWLVLRALVRANVYDRPNPRSSHSLAKPRGGGLALIPAVLGAWLVAAFALDAAAPGFWAVLAGALGLAAVSWVDDLRGLPALLRLALQAAAVGLGLAALGGGAPVFQGLLPPLLDRLAAGLLWLWFVNLFNFMDGIDGISGVEAITLGLGLLLVGSLTGAPAAARVLPALLAAAALGFLVWNWAPAKLFLGDVGSVPLGYLLGWLLLWTAMTGQWAAALVLPLYYLADATITLARRALKGAKVWRAHREHFYQRAVQGGASHARVATWILAGNGVLVAAALVAASGHDWLGLALGAVATAVLLWRLDRRARPR